MLGLASPNLVAYTGSARDPVGTLYKRFGFVCLTTGQPLFLAPAGPNEYRSEKARPQARDEAKFCLDLAS